MPSLLRDLRFGARMLAKHPGLSAISVVAFTLGIGLTTTMFSIVHGGLQDLPFEDAERLMHLERNRLAQGIRSMEVTLHDYADWEAQQTSFENLAAFYMGTANVSGSEGRPERFDAAFLTADAFDLLRVRPALGRALRSGEDAPGAPKVAILGHRMWRERYGADPAILGRNVRINGESHTVVGVMAEGFRFPISQDLWLPLGLDPADHERGEGTTLEVFGRLRDGVTLAEARAEFDAIAARLATAYPDTNAGVGSVIKPYTREFIGDEAESLLYTMLAAVFGVFLIACANVANLLLGRTALRSKEVAVRSALGAGRLRVVVQLLAETLVLAGVGGALGLGLAVVGIRLFEGAIAPIDPPFWLDFEIDPTDVAFILGITLLASLLSGLVPALQASGQRAHEVLKDESRSGTGFRLGRFSKALVVTEIALSCGLLVAAGLMIKSVTNLRTVDYGFEPAGIFTARVGLFESDYPDAAARQRFFAELERRAAAIPGVRSAAVSASLPGFGTARTAVAVEGETYARPDEHPLARRDIITPGYFATLEAPILDGRAFSDQDRAGELPVTIVNRSFAARHFPGESPLGRRIRPGGADSEEPWRTIVGVVPDLYMDGLGDTRNPEPEGFYLPLAQSDLQFAFIAARTAGEEMAITAAVRDEVAALDPELPIYWVQPLTELLARETWFYGVFGTLFVVFGGAALFLAAVGLYGVMAFAASRRTHEVGIRMALGARAAEVLRLIFRQGMLQLALGLALGLALALPLSRLIEILLFQVEPWDPAVFAAILAVLTATGTAACLIPARRAARVEPAVALRKE